MRRLMIGGVQFFFRHLYPFSRGRGRILDRTPLGRMRFQERTIVARTSDGVDLRVFANDLIGRNIYFTGEFERIIVEVLVDLAVPGDVLLDVGANIGYVSASFLHLVPGSCVVAVEPLPDVHDVLTENLTRFGARSTTCRAALSNRAGRARMRFFEGNIGGSALVAPNEAGEGPEVELVTLDDLISRCGLIDRVGLVKLDVEGHELQVFEAMRPMLAEGRPRAIVFEHRGPLAGHPIHTLLTTAGYDAFGIRKKLRGYELVPIDRPGNVREQFGDYLARRRGPGSGTPSGSSSSA